MPTVLGWDSETTNGFVQCLVNSRGTFAEESDTLTLLDFLFDEGLGVDYNVFWNVRFDFGAIIKPWVLEQAPTLKANHRRKMALNKEIALLDAKAFVDEKRSKDDRLRRRAALAEIRDLESVERFDVGKYRILYIPKKGFRITRAQRKRGRNSVTFFDAMVFYATGIEDAAALDPTAKKYLGQHKTAADEGVDVARLGSEEGYYKAHREPILRYCLRDSQLTARLFEMTIAGFDRIHVPFPKEPWSRASVGREILKRSGVLETTRKAYAKLAKTGHARIWEQAYAGACILTRGVGAWPDVSKWDINSAYPAAMEIFPSLEGAYLVGRDDPRFDRCFFRFFEIDLVPTPRRALRGNDGGRDNLLYHEGGEPRRVCVTALDLKAFDLWGDSYTIVDAVGVVTPSTDRPLALMRELYRRKSEVKEEFGDDSVEYLNAKIPLNGVYGILAQSRPREGRFTNFIYAAYITAYCRLALWTKTKEIQESGGTVLAQMTDGLFVSGLPSLPEPSKDLGAWDVEFEGLVVLFANGLYYVPKKATPRFDGLKKRGAPDLTVAALMASDRPYVTTARTRPLGLKQGIIRGTPELIGVFAEETKTLCPARMLEDSGLRMSADLRAAPLSAFFNRSWVLEHRTPTEAHMPHRVLEVAAE